MRKGLLHFSKGCIQLRGGRVCKTAAYVATKSGKKQTTQPPWIKLDSLKMVRREPGFKVLRLRVLQSTQAAFAVYLRDSRKSLLGPGLQPEHPVPAGEALSALPIPPSNQIAWERDPRAGGWVV